MSVKVCVCVHFSWLKGGTERGWPIAKIASKWIQTCTRVFGKAGHESKDS